MIIITSIFKLQERLLRLAAQAIIILYGGNWIITAGDTTADKKNGVAGLMCIVETIPVSAKS